MSLLGFYGTLIPSVLGGCYMVARQTDRQDRQKGQTDRYILDRF